MFVLCFERRLQEGESRVGLDEVPSGEGPGKSNRKILGQDYAGIQSAPDDMTRLQCGH